ncbi:MAG: RNA methyltransferase [Spirochaetes bacterium]|nr:RNA methyltransferase [Spirochaetota bacterium]
MAEGRGGVIVFGFHAVSDLVEKSGFLDGDKLIVARQASGDLMQRLLAKAQRAKVQVIRKNYGELNQIAGTKNHQGIILERAAALELKSFTKQDFVGAEGGLYLALDGVQDPQNLGAICRSALALGVQGIFLPQKDSAPAGATALKASAGTMVEMPLCFTGSIASLMQFIHDKNPDIAMIALDKSGELFAESDHDFAAGGYPTLLVVGSEQGLSRLALERATHRRRLRIGDKVESYNVSVATALALYCLTK